MADVRQVDNQFVYTEYTRTGDMRVDNQYSYVEYERVGDVQVDNQFVYVEYVIVLGGRVVGPAVQCIG